MSQLGGMGGLRVLASSVWRPGQLLHVLQFTAQFPTTKNYLVQMSIVEVEKLV